MAPGEALSEAFGEALSEAFGEAPSEAHKQSTTDLTHDLGQACLWPLQVQPLTHCSPMAKP